jgi:serine phosphatase RsbU (regulator of sigma subunit)
MHRRPSSLDIHRELDNFLKIATAHIPQPGDMPVLPGIEIAGFTTPLHPPIGGDHIIYLDFGHRFDLERRIREARSEAVRECLERNRHRAGILLADVAGHQATDATLHIGLHHAFLTGALYELDQHGEITARLFENLNTRFFQTSNYTKFITMLYGEISSDGQFAFLSAGHPAPVVYSREYGRLMAIDPVRLQAMYPIGMFPSEDSVDRDRHGSPYALKKRYPVNTLQLLNRGDVLILHTDGLLGCAPVADDDLAGPASGPSLDRLEAVLRRMHDLPITEIAAAIEHEVLAAGPPDDDVSVVIVRRC